MAELVDALASGASVFTDVLVQIQSRAPLQQSLLSDSITLSNLTISYIIHLFIVFVKSKHLLQSLIDFSPIILYHLHSSLNFVYTNLDCPLYRRIT